MTLLTRFLASIGVIAAILHGQSAGEKVSTNGVKAQEESGQKTVPLRTHSLTAPYLDSDLQSRWYNPPLDCIDVRWEFGGDTVIDAHKYARILADV
jgi:hypothetical protein